MFVEEHEGVFVVVCVEEGSMYVNGGYIAVFVSINGGSNHNAVGSNSGGGAVFHFVTRFPAFPAAVSARVGVEGFQCHFAFGRAERASFNRVVYLVVMELGELSNGRWRLAGMTKFLDACLRAVCLCKCNGSGLGVGVMD
jgi:hypothetical protein